MPTNALAARLPRHDSVLRTVAGILAAFFVATLVGAFPATHAATTPLKAVVIVGPTHGSTATYLTRGEAIARVAASHGMTVRRVFHPNATWQNVLSNIQGANLVVYLGHGNGWPSPYAPFQTLTKDGFGLNPVAGGSPNDVKYYGEGPIGDQVRLAPNAVVLLNHLCYASGNGESGMPIPTASVATQRVDNYGAGFLRAGARAVFAYGHQTVSDVINALFTTDSSMDGIFMGKGYTGGADVRFTSVRTSGARGHLDKTSSGYLRSVVGDLAFTAQQFRGSDTVAPVLTTLAAVRYSYAFGSSTQPAVFTPNGDGSADRLTVAYTVSEASTLRVSVRNAAGTVVRAFNVSAPWGSGSFAWDGKDGAGAVVPDGRYTVTAVPHDRAGNAGLAKSTLAQALTALAKPRVTPNLIFARDGDALAPSTVLGFSLTRSATVSWRVVDAAGATVVTRWTDRSTPAGGYSFTWNGRNAAGSFVPDGFYYQLVTARTAEGTVTFRHRVHLGAFRITKSVAAAAPGTRVTVTIVSAEPLSADPVLRVYQPGLAAFSVPGTLVSGRTYRASFVVRTGGTSGAGRLAVVGTDTGGRSQQSQTPFSVL